MKSLKTIGLLLATVLFLFACVKEKFEVGDRIDFPDPKEVINTSFTGKVVDENGESIENAEVIAHVFENGQISDRTAYTDKDGIYTFFHVNNPGSSAYVSVTKSGYFDAFKRHFVLEDRISTTTIKMKEFDIVGSFDAGSGGMIQLQSGAELNVPANSVADQAGRQYMGQVDVAMHWIDPTAEDLSERIVGDLSGIDDEGQMKALTTFGMLQIELRNQSGDELNLLQNKKAQLTFPIPSDILAEAPDVIPLWTYDEDLGYWVEEGEAHLRNDEYVGEVHHFSSFNVDVKDDPICVQGRVVWEQPDGPGAGYLNIFVCIDGMQVGGKLCDDGSFLFYNFPKGKVFSLKIYGSCGDLLFEQEYGPFYEKKDLGEIKVLPPSGQVLVNISGNTVDCDGSAASNAIIYFWSHQGLQSYFVNKNGEFGFHTLLCRSEVAHLKAIDFLQGARSTLYEIKDSQSEYVFRDIDMCSSSSADLWFTVDGIDYEVFVFNASAGSSGVGFIGGFSDSFSISADDDMDGVSTFWMAYYGTPGDQNYFSGNPRGQMTGDDYTIEVTWTSYNLSSGGRVAGTFAGFVSKVNVGPFDIPISGGFDFILD